MPPPNLKFTDDSFERFFGCTKGIPFYINMFANSLPNEVELDNQLVKKYFKRVLPILGVHLINQWGRLTLQEQKIITALIEKPLKHVDITKSLNVTSGSLSHPLNSLENNVLIDFNNGKYEIIDSVLRFWLLNHYKEHEVFPYRSI